MDKKLYYEFYKNSYIIAKGFLDQHDEIFSNLRIKEIPDNQITLGFNTCSYIMNACKAFSQFVQNNPEITPSNIKIMDQVDDTMNQAYNLFIAIYAHLKDDHRELFSEAISEIENIAD